MKKLVRIFDNETVVLQLLKKIFEKRGYTVFIYTDPAESDIYHSDICLCTPGRLCTDILITDIRMGGIDGVAFVQKLRERGCRIPHIAMISAYWDGYLLMMAKRLGCAILQKPFSLADIYGWIDERENGRALFATAQETPEISGIDDTMSAGETTGAM
ncbi:MAG: response regulator [Chitinivibrionales bacterium]|nr:response regulator [Chitinivibrionales bacterium]